MHERKYVRLFLIGCSLIVLYLSAQIFRPFLYPIALAVVLASLLYPQFETLSTRLRGCKGWAALIICLGVLFLIVLPLIFLLLLLAGEVSEVYGEFQLKLEQGYFERWLRPGVGGFLERFRQQLGNYVDLSRVSLSTGVGGGIQQLSLFFLRQSAAILAGLFHLMVHFFVLMISLFFLLRDGGRLAAEVKSWSPLSERYENLIVTKFREVANATIIGSLLTALVQGVAGGLVFWTVGISNPLLWGALTALFSLVPVVGTAVIWLPWTLYFISTGAFSRALVLAALEIFFVGMTDNILRPLLIEGRAKMHTLLVFFSIAGGVAYFGISGVIFGPLVLALGLTFLELYKEEFREELVKSSEP
ncbi:MAG: AI-2E family transporter [Acidobacteria bacterium]|nr:AI-2E family transporter [Acidobacteriota bacterium]